MNNGKSRLIPPLSANIMAMIAFLLCFIICVTNGFWGWLALITLALTVLLFFIEGNSFVKKCTIQIVLYYVVTLLSTLIFYVLFGRIHGAVGTVFRVIDWVIRAVVAIFALISAIQAYSGRFFNAPVIGSLTNRLAKKLGVF